MKPAATAFLWNGTDFAPCENVPLTDRGFRYGMALFESVAVRGGRAEFLDAHLARLEAAARRCGWPMERAAWVRAGERLPQLDGPAFARVYVTAGDGAPTAPVTAPRVFLFAEPREAAPQAAIRVRVHPEPFLPLFGGLKTANYWANAEALRQAREAGFGEALLFNPRGELVSACMANVFVELGGRLVTPPLSSGARAGVTREWVMQRRAVAERGLTRADLQNATACFLTSCWAGIVPVAALEERPLDTPFAETLRAEFFSRA
ncbi:MAG: aminotransferase class IV [Chthoniobacteraceae bacterium]|nr:aminotransferase class IV [Chthoniobacteraceae bacterium]